MTMSRIPFGIHRGRPLCDVPASYLKWCLTTLDDLRPEYRAAIQAELDRRGWVAWQIKAYSARLETMQDADAETFDRIRSHALKALAALRGWQMATCEVEDRCVDVVLS